jgi:cytochrome d ubiquinol oxidase subunit I
VRVIRWRLQYHDHHCTFLIPAPVSLDNSIAGCLLMPAAHVAGWWLRMYTALLSSGCFLRVCEIASALGFLAVLAGWTTTEVGRQPWTIFGLLRTRHSVPPSFTGGDVALSVLYYAVAYVIVYTVGFRHLLRFVRRR